MKKIVICIVVLFSWLLCFAQDGEFDEQNEVFIQVMRNMSELLQQNLKEVDKATFEASLAELKAECDGVVSQAIERFDPQLVDSLAEDEAGYYAFLSSLGFPYGFKADASKGIYRVNFSPCSGMTIVCFGFTTYHGDCYLLTASIDFEAKTFCYIDKLGDPLLDIKKTSLIPKDDIIRMFSDYNEDTQTAPLTSEATDALSTIRKCFDVFILTNGTCEGYTIEIALKDARLDAQTMRNWSFETFGNPPHTYLASSTQDIESEDVNQIWYDVVEAKYHGFGIDDEEFSLGR